MKKIGLLIIICLGFVQINYSQQKSFEKVESKYFKNMYKINNVLYRAEQPSKKGFLELEATGFKTILNLRRLKNNTKKAKRTHLKLEHIPIKTKELNEEEIVQVLKIIEKAEQPILVHCWYGSDRTGTIIAAYRIIVENWSKKDAITEFTNEVFGYHKKRYPNLLKLLKNLDVDAIKKQLKPEARKDM